MMAKNILLAVSTLFLIHPYCRSQQFPPGQRNGNLLIGVGINPPLVEKYLDISSSPSVPSYRGLLIDVISLIKAELGPEFNYQFVENDDLSTSRNATGFSGQIGDLIVGRIQVAAGPFFAEDLNASQFYQFAMPYTPEYGLSMLMKSDMNGKSGINHYQKYTLFMDYVLNLDSVVWGVITACYVVACFLWFFIDRITGCCGPMDTYNVWSLIAKLTFANWLLFFVIVTALIVDDEKYYTNFRSDSMKSIQSFDDVNKQSSSIRYLIVNNSRAANYLQNLADLEGRYIDSQLETVFRKPPTTVTAEERAYFDSLVQQSQPRNNFRDTWSKIQNSNGFVRNIEEAKNMMLRDSTNDYVFIGDLPEVSYAAMTTCTLDFIQTNVARKPMAIAFPVNSPLKERFDGAIQKLWNQRKIAALTEKWWYKNPNRSSCNNSSYGGKTQLYRLVWIFAALCISAALALAAGLAVGGIFAVIESCFMLCCRHKDAEFTTTRNTQPVIMVQRNGLE